MGNSKNLKKGNPKTQFSSKNQPSPEAKSEGKKKGILLKNIAAQLISGEAKEALKPLAEYLEIDIDQVDLEMAMHLKQMELAIKQGDTRAYNAILDRLNGKPIQAIIDKTPPTPTILQINPLSNELTTDNGTEEDTGPD